MAFSNTLSVIRQYVSSAVGDLEIGQCGTTGATTTKIYAPFLWKANDYYNNHFYEVYVYAGTNVGVVRRVTDWVLADLLLTVHTAYAAACDATSYIEIHRIFTEDEYRKAINLGIESIKGKYLIDKTDVSITLISDVYEYTLPDDVSHIHRITVENEADGGEFPSSNIIDPRSWILISPRKVKLDSSYFYISSGYDLRVEGQGEQLVVDDDTDIIYLPPNWLVAEAILNLPKSKIQSNALDGVYAQAVRDVEYYRRNGSNLVNPFAKTVIE